MKLSVRNPLPLTVRLNAGLPAVAVTWLRLVMTGVTGLMVKVKAFETSGVPFGTWLTTVTLAVAGRINRPASIVAIN